MTTAHRATWKAARGGLQEEGSFSLHVPSAAVSAKDAPQDPALKLRSDASVARASRAELRAALESGGSRARKRARFELPPVAPLALGGGVPEAFRGEGLDDVRALDDDAVLDEEDGNEGEGSGREGTVSARVGKEGGEASGQADSELDSDSDSESESEDEEAELVAELERIRKEREFEKAKEQAEEQERLEREETARAASGNPLLGNVSIFNDEISDTASIATSSVPGFGVKRRWDDDVIFRAQAQGERKPTQRFINDTIRNDFHRSFMKRYML